MPQTQAKNLCVMFLDHLFPNLGMYLHVTKAEEKNERKAEYSEAQALTNGPLVRARDWPVILQLNMNTWQM